MWFEAECVCAIASASGQGPGPVSEHALLVLLCRFAGLSGGLDCRYGEDLNPDEPTVHRITFRSLAKQLKRRAAIAN